MNAVVTQPKNCPFGTNTTTEHKNMTTSDNTDTLVRRNIPRWMSLLSDVAVTFLGSVVVFTENVQFFFIVPQLHSVSDLASNGKVVISWQQSSSTTQEIPRILWNPKVDQPC